MFQDYQHQRILTFFDPQRDPYGRGYHVRQAVTAVGAGGLFGRGLGSGSQSQLKFIPASQTDFIFAVIAEELGFLGAILTLVLAGKSMGLIGPLLGLSTGMFLYISSADILPELVHGGKRENRWPVAGFFLTGIVLVFILTKYLPG